MRAFVCLRHTLIHTLFAYPAVPRRRLCFPTGVAGSAVVLGFRSSAVGESAVFPARQRDNCGSDISTERIAASAAANSASLLSSKLLPNWRVRYTGPEPNI